MADNQAKTRYPTGRVRKQRLKEAIWRVQGICGSLYHGGRLPKYKLQIIDAELRLLADALGVEALA